MFEERLRAAADCIESLGYAPAYVSLHGSQNYGLAIHTDEYESDYDFKCVVLPSLWDLVEGRKPASLTVETAEGQIDVKDIRIFCDALERMNPAYLESIATAQHLILPGSEKMAQIRAALPRLMAQRAGVFAKSCEGLFEDKAKRMRHDSPAAHERIVRYGYDGKQAHHMLRLLLLLEEFEKNGGLRFEAPKEAREELTQLKLNRIPLEDAEGRIAGWRTRMRVVRGRIEEKYGEPKKDAHAEIVRLAREMMLDHCRKT
ncbi:MAG: nucleotidyltransferase domain-containing protein [Clostridia bacterium]|nr:nucleotidyltransferase domain-containing protein [Clostridia bacterium]